MKKRFFALTVLIIILSAILPIKAEPNYDGSVYRFNDYNEAVSEDEFRALNTKINENIEPLTMDFPIFILDEYTFDGELYEYAEIVYKNNKFGYGEKVDGIFLVLDEQNSRFGIYFYGNAENNIPKAKKQWLKDKFSELYADESYTYYMTMDEYLNCVFSLVTEWHLGKPDKPNGMPYWYTDDVSTFQDYHAGNPPRVVDNAGILTEEQKAELTEQVERICNTYDYSYVIFTDDSTHGLSREVYGADFIYFGGYGKGDDYSAVCFFLCLEEGNRGWLTISTNSYEEVYTSDVTYTIDEIVDSDMRSGNYYTAIKKQADYIEKSLSEGNFELIERPKPKKTNFFGWPLIVGIIISLIISGMTVSDMKSKMRLHTAVSANEYLVKGSLNIRNLTKKLMYVTVSKRKKNTESSGGGGGGSSYSSGSSSSGGSYSAGGRSF